MLGQQFSLDKYNWNVVVLYEVDKSNLNQVMHILTKFCNDHDVLQQAYNNISAGQHNTGFIYSDFRKYQSIIVIGKGSSNGEVMNTIAHEANHLQSHIATVYDLDEKGEEVCYLIGTIIKNMYKVFRKIICS